MNEIDKIIERKIADACDKVVAIRMQGKLSPANDPNVDLLKTGKDITEYLGMSWNTFKKAYWDGAFGKAAWDINKKYYFKKSLFQKPEVF
jgi:hypothetical protein